MTFFSGVERVFAYIFFFEMIFSISLRHLKQEYGGLESGGLESGGLESRATDFGSGWPEI